MDKSFHQLLVREKRQETADSVSLIFEVPAELKDTFNYTQGQYLTLKFNIRGQEARRAYSMCSSPVEEHLAVTVKRVKKGLVSNFIHDDVEVGQHIEVMPPDGRFFSKLDPDNKKTYYLFGAGSGITPLYSILKTILEKEPMSVVHLLYGNRNEDSIIFEQQLEELQQKYTGQITVKHILSQPKKQKAKGLSGFLGKGTINWKGAVGRINHKEVKTFLEANPIRNQEGIYFICGPGDMIDNVEAALTKLDIDKKAIYIEHFNTPNSDAGAKVAGTDGAKMKVQLGGEIIELAVPAGKTILDVLIDAKYDPPYSCTSGACSTCMAKVTKGSVKMDACYALDDDEVAEGYILTCQAHPTSDEVELNYDV